MKSVLLFRIAAILALLQYAAHGLMFSTYKPSHGQAEINFVNEMKTQFWIFGGHPRSYWDFYFGYGLLSVLSGLIEVLLLFYAARTAKHYPELAKRVAIILFIGVLCHLLLVQRYFFLLPAVFDFIIAGILVTAIRTKTVIPSENKAMAF
jgi:predicted acyltransferase